MAKKKTIKSAPVKSGANSNDFTIKTENKGAFRFNKDCYLYALVNSETLDVSLGAIINGETYATTTNLAGGSTGGGVMIRYISDGDQSSDIEILSGYPLVKVPAGASMSVRYNEGDWEPCTITEGSWISTSGYGGIDIQDNFIMYMAYSYNSEVKLLDGDSVDFKWEV